MAANEGADSTPAQATASASASSPPAVSSPVPAPASAPSPSPAPAPAPAPAPTGIPATVTAPIEVDAAADAAAQELADRSDADSAFESQISAYTASLSSSVVDYPIEHGRRYHAFRGGAYPMPNDDQEIARLDLTHLLITKTIGDLFLCPIDTDQIRRVLDMGTGTGIWAIEMGDLLPGAEILGNDLSPIQPAWLPPNVKFEVDDIESPWLHETPFDFIFLRYMTACIVDFNKLAQNTYDALNPGGWAEFQDFDLQYYSDDGTLKEHHHTYIWITTLLDAMRRTGREPSPGPLHGAHLRNAGFQNVKHHRYKIPIGAWAKDPHMKDIGMCNMAQIMDGLEAFSLRVYCGFLKWSEEEVLVLLANVRKELRAGIFHALFDYYVAYGQKPGSLRND